MPGNPVTFAAQLSDLDRSAQEGTYNVTLANSLAVAQISNVLYAWRNTQISNYDAIWKIDAIVKEFREDIY